MMKKKNSISRKKFLPLLGSGLIIPFAVGAQIETEDNSVEDHSYQTMLTKDGKLVKVKPSSVKDSNVLENKISNKSLLDWLEKNDDNI